MEKSHLKTQLLVTALLLSFVTGAWAEVKWIQRPDETRNGIDIRIDRHDQIRRVLADDFECTRTGPITDVHFWGSWKGDPVPKGYIYSIHLSIHKDVPADPVNPDSYSHPGELLWERDFTQNEFTETLYKDIAPDYEWWWDVYDASVGPDPVGDQKIWQYDIYIDESEAFIQEGTLDNPEVYWLDIYVLTEFGDFGWKTSSEHWNDDAVAGNPAGTSPQWRELRYPPNHPYFGESIDMAFAITTKTIVDPNEACCFEDPAPTCLDLTPADCIEKGGTPQGPGTVCQGDTNGNGIDEACEDCNDNGIPDFEEIATGLSKDCNQNGIPDECEEDCNGNGIPDECDIAGGTSLDLDQNGIPDECECGLEDVTCPEGGPATVIASTSGGSPDNFAAPPEPTSPDAALLSYITTCSYPGIPLQFDNVPGEGGVSANSWFGHTFTGLPVGIVAAKLEVRARATAGGGSGLVYNDTISIIDSISGCAATSLWGRRFGDLPEAGGSWTAGEVQTFCLDLAALPTPTGPVSVIDSLASGSLSIFAQDDTGIDYIILTIYVCECEFRYVTEYVAGIDDVFTLPTEPAFPSTELVTAYPPGPWRRFDQIVANRRFGHTFSGLPSGIVAAELEFRVRAHSDIPTNDRLVLEFLNPSWAYGNSLATLTGTTWTSGTEKLITLDLDNLPPATSGVIGATSVLSNLSDGDLDMYIQDDTAIDYAILRIWRCCEADGPGHPGDLDHDDWLSPNDISILVSQLLPYASSYYWVPVP